MTLREALPDGFFDEIWQRVPARLPGLATAVAPQFIIDPRALRDAVTSHSASRGDGRTIWFLEGATDTLPEIARLRAEAIQVFEWDDIWFDLFVARRATSIGRHFDDSDNITMQLAGSKRWRLRPPSSISPAARRLRALGEPGVGSLPDDTSTSGEDQIHLLGPGDALYIPSMWSHEGVSESDGVSISLVINTATVLHALLPELLRSLRTSAIWSQVLATGPGSAARRRKQLDAATRPSAMSGLGAALEIAAVPALRTKTSPRREPPALQLDMDWLRQYLGRTPRIPAAGLVLFDPHSSAAIASVAARRTAKRFATALVTSSARTSERRAKLIYAAVAALLPALTPGEVDRVMTDPDITSWTAHAARRGDDPQLRVPLTIDPGVDVLAMALLPELAAHHGGPPLLIHPPADIDGAVTLRRLRLRIGAPEAGLLALLVADGTVTAVERAALTEIAEPLPVVGVQDGSAPSTGPVLCRAASRWFEEHAPAGAGTYASDDESFGELVSCLRAAAGLLDQCYPAAAAVFQSSIRVLLPLPSIGHRANNYSLPTFRGLIATSVREPYMIAQAIAHETARNQVNSVLEIVRLCRNPAEKVISPVAGLPRPLTALFQGSIAFVQDIHVSRALLAAGHPASERIQRYLDGRVETVRETITVLRRSADLSPAGSTIVMELEQALAGAGSQLVRVQEKVVEQQ